MKFSPLHSTKSFRRAIGSVALVLLASFSLPSVVEAADGNEAVAGSLKFVPANVSAYSVSLHLREQFDEVVNSKAWKKLVDLPLVHKAWAAMKENDEFSEGLEQMEEFFNDPQNKEMLAMFGDMASDEIFTYGDENWPQVLAMLMQVQTASNYGPIFAQLRGEQHPELAQVRALFDLLDKNRDKLHIPHTVIGFKVKDLKRATAQLERLEMIASAGAGMVPELQGRVQSKTIGETKYLTLNLDGSMIPWDEVPFDNFAENQGQYDKLVEKLKALKLVIGIGLRENYVLISLGESLDPLTKLGQGPKLTDRPEFKKVATFADKKIYSISYASQELHDAFENNRGQMIYIRDELNKVIAEGNLPDEAKARIQKDLNNLGTDLTKNASASGAVLDIGFRSAKGIEGYTYDWAEHRERDASKPLSLLNHVGGNPLAFSISRTKPSLDSYQLLAKWLQVGYCYVEDFAVPLLGNAEKEKYDKFVKQFIPLVKRIDATTRLKLFPALADGQMGFVLDAKIASKQWYRDFSPTKQALPMFEPAIIWGVSNAELLKTGLAEYREAINDFFGSFDISDNPLALVRIPEADDKEISGGTMFYYGLLDLAGFDSQIVPNGSISKDTAVLGISSKQSERILATTPLNLPGILPDAKRPLAAASYFDTAGFMDALEPWVLHGVRSASDLPGFLDFFGLLADGVAIPKIKADIQDPPEVKVVVDQVHTIFEIIKCFQSYSSVTYLENGVWVSHHEMVIRDVP